MPLIRLDKVSLAYGHRALLDQVTLEIHPAERVCLVGRNGEGKSSLVHSCVTRFSHSEKTGL